MEEARKPPVTREAALRIALAARALPKVTLPALIEQLQRRLGEAIDEENLRQVTVKKVDAAIGSTPAALLFSGEALEKNFTLSEAGAREGLDWVEAIPKSPDSGFEKLQLGFEGSDLKAMQLLDNFGQTTSLAFSRIEHNPSIAASQFRFTPPAGVDVIGE